MRETLHCQPPMSRARHFSEASVWEEGGEEVYSASRVAALPCQSSLYVCVGVREGGGRVDGRARAGGNDHAEAWGHAVFERECMCACACVRARECVCRQMDGWVKQPEPVKILLEDG